MRCLSGHNSEANLERHLLYCNDHDVAKVVMPKPGSMLRFINFQKKMKCPYIIYTDCESIIKPLESPALHGQHTTRETEHVPCSVGYVVIRSDGVMTNQLFYRGGGGGMPWKSSYITWRRRKSVPRRTWNSQQL